MLSGSDGEVMKHVAIDDANSYRMIKSSEL